MSQVNPVILLLAVIFVIAFPKLGDACATIIHVAVVYAVFEFIFFAFKSK